MTSGIGIRSDDANNCGKNFKNNFGYLLNNCNNVNMNTQRVALFTSAYGDGHGFGLNEDNFLRCTALFTARRTIQGNWMNSKDEYIAPDTTNLIYPEFEADSIVYSLFDSASNQSSLRDVDYKDKTWQIKNEFFWMSRDEMSDLAEEYNNEDLYNDIRSNGDDERYVYKLLFEQGYYDKLSSEARDVIDTATELVRMSFADREDFYEEHIGKIKDNYQLNNWDCGYYQLKQLWGEEYPNEFKEFKAKVKALKDKLIPQVYEVGFLRK